jgi:circadian clock protein KaiC
MLTRVFDTLKSRGIQALFTSLTPGSGTAEETHAHVSSLMDSWIVLSQGFESSKRVRRLYLVKSRGVQHSLDSRKLLISPRGLTLEPLAPTAVGHEERQ